MQAAFASSRCLLHHAPTLSLLTTARVRALTRSLSSKAAPLPKSTDPPRSKRTEADIINFRFKATSLFKAGKDEEAMTKINAVLDKCAAANAHKAHERAVTMLLKMHQFLDASIIYARMCDEGFLPSVPLLCKMMFLRMVTRRKTKEDEVIPVVEEMFRLVPDNDVFLRDIVDILGYNTKYSADIYPAVLEAYVRVNGEDCSTSVQTRRLLVRYMKKKLPKGHSLDEHLDEWGQSALRYLEEHKPAHFETFKETVSSHSAGQVLGRLFLKARMHYQAFQIYMQLKEMLDFVPREATFTTLFLAHGICSRPRTFRTRQDRPIVGIPSLRALYLDMHRTHRAAKANKFKRKPITVVSLHAALRAFLNARDYAAAYVVVRAFPAHRLPFSINAYRIVIGHFLEHIAKSEYGASQNWTDAFFFRSRPHIAEPSMTLLEKVLSLGAIPDKGVTARKPVKMPSAAMVMGMEDCPRGGWKIGPVCRILMRAMFASFPAGVADGNFGLGADSSLSPAKLAGLAVANAKAQMMQSTSSRTAIPVTLITPTPKS
ncbi:hypothetical protein EIP91_008496 [Steccherinum ochraceum]|uniref:Uncharacterized protein n=1 Tax=Steccherinum ochraceum TaxID=92696 RepID=A0A4R0RKI2_9APHY|nr:hypothetical protein EIP91_008496 [Steccherinum ochraceum]